MDSFGFAFLGAIIIGIVSIALNVLTGDAHIIVQRRPPPSQSPSNDNGR